MKKLWLAFILMVILGGVLFFWGNILNFYAKLSLKLPDIERSINYRIVQEIEKQVSTPPPLRSSKEEAQSFLTRPGVIIFTNIEREKFGLPPLKENAKLDSSADIKAKDMLNKQYFAHESPSSIGVVDLAKTVGYDFIEIGENLALGNFKDDQTLVQAWMDSPGHRANILNPQHQEIGVSVVRGTFEGKITWFAVQHFGFPLSACLQPSQNLKTEIDLNQSQIQKLQANLDSLKNEIQNMRPKPRAVYNQKIEEYDNLVSRYNSLVAETKVLINQYNNEVQGFNSCVSVAK
jgi:uncharacterized protein YkwD